MVMSMHQHRQLAIWSTANNADCLTNLTTQNKSVFSLLLRLSTRHCSHVPHAPVPAAVDRRDRWTLEHHTMWVVSIRMDPGIWNAYSSVPHSISITLMFLSLSCYILNQVLEACREACSIILPVSHYQQLRFCHSKPREIKHPSILDPSLLILLTLW